MKKYIEHPLFEKFIIGLILVNWITMGLETSKSIMQSFWSILLMFDKIVIAIFTIEAILKIYVYKKSYFKNWWNIFDFLIVIVSLMPAHWPFQVLRILRVFRLFRLISVVLSLRKIVSALLDVIPWMISIIILLLTIFYVYAIMTTQLYWQTFPDLFGHLWKSFYSLFQIMTLDSRSSWIVAPIMEVHKYSWILFISFVLISTFIMLNLVIAVVVDAMNKISSSEEKNISKQIKLSENATKEDFKKLEEKIDKLLKKIK